MSRPTTSQIIGKGDYLLPDFDPKTLTIAHLIGIFAYHQISYPPQHNKAKLVELYNEKIKKNGVTLRKQWQERQETLASEEGVVNGVTGSPVQKVRALLYAQRRAHVDLLDVSSAGCSSLVASCEPRAICRTGTS